jgi:hypothetical protein
MPPVEPSQEAAVSVAPSVAELYWGTRTTWNLSWPIVVVALALW